MPRLNVRQGAGVEVIRAAARQVKDVGSEVESIEDGATLRGQFVVQHFRKGKRINEYHFKNGITNEGKNKLLNVMFNNQAQVSTWYLGLIDNNNFSALADTDTYDDINQAANGWDEFTNYTDANNGGSSSTRPEWLEDAASGQSITNSSVSIYDITGTATVKGIFVVGGIAAAQTKGDHAPGGTLWSTALFTSGDVPVVNGDQLKLTYTVSA